VPVVSIELETMADLKSGKIISSPLVFDRTHQSSKNCEYIGFVFKYASSDTPISITVSLVRNPTTTQD